MRAGEVSLEHNRAKGGKENGLEGDTESHVSKTIPGRDEAHDELIRRRAPKP